MAGRLALAAFCMVGLSLSGVVAVAAQHGHVQLPRVKAILASGQALRIVAFGSSSTLGVGASTPAAAYPAQLQEDLTARLNRGPGAVTVINRGIGGDAIDQMLARFDRDVLAAKPQLVIWQIGSNDPMRGVDLAHFREAATATVRRMREAGIDVVLMEPQWCPKLESLPRTAQFRDAVREIGAAEGVPVIRRTELMHGWIADRKLTEAEMIAPDGLHMRDAGYNLLAEAVAGEILGDAAN